MATWKQLLLQRSGPGPANCRGLSPPWIFLLAPTLPRDSPPPLENYSKISNRKAVPVKNRGGWGCLKNRKAEIRGKPSRPLTALSVLG